MDANFVLSQKGTILLKDDGNQQIQREQEQDLKAMCASFDSVPLNTYLFNIASLLANE